MNKILRYDNNGKEVIFDGLEFDDSVGKIVIKNQLGMCVLFCEFIGKWEDGILMYDTTYKDSVPIDQFPLYYCKGEEKIYLKYIDIKSVELSSERTLVSRDAPVVVREDGRVCMVDAYYHGALIEFACYDYIKELKYIRMEDINRWGHIVKYMKAMGVKGEYNIVLTMGWCYSPKTDIESEINVMKKLVDVLGIKKCLVHRKLGIGKINDYEKEVITECYKIGVEVIGEVGKVNREGKIEKEIDGNSEI